MEKIKSFQINHLLLNPGIYVSRKDKAGDTVLTTFDIRMTKPNFEPVMNTAEIHTIEHLAATYLRNHEDYKDKVIYFGPMGCRTGFYLILAGDYKSENIVDLMISMFEFIRHYHDPIPGAKEFLDELRSLTQVIIISDTFAQFATPLMKKLGWPTIFCNSLEVAESGEITGFKMRCEQSKLTTVKALQSIGFETIASGDSYNDLGMIKASKAGFLFKSTEQIKKDNPELAAYETYDELLAAIKEHLD